MKLDRLRDSIQQKALKAWVESGKKGTCQIITGLGKTFISLHALYSMPRDERIHLFLAEQTDRVTDLRRDIEKYNELFKRDVLNDYNLQFHCYQSVYKWTKKDFGLVICDEIHDSLSPAYSKFYFNNTYTAIIGLSATISRNTRYETNGIITTKGELLDSIAPICFTYNIDDGHSDHTSRELQVYIIHTQLNNENKVVKAGNKKVTFYQTEKAAYDYWDKQHKRAWFIKDEADKQLKIRITASKRSKILYNLTTKIKATKDLLNALKTKTIVFGNSLDSLLRVTPNVINSRNSVAENNRIREDFDSGKIQVIGSFKKLKQGANLIGLDNCVIMSYYSTDKDFIQRIGRLRNSNKIGTVFIILTDNTQEEKWLEKIFKNITKLNIIHCKNVTDCISKYKKTL